MSDDTWESSDVDPYMTFHYMFTWGKGGIDLWKGNWYVDELVPIGYLWGHLHQESLEARDKIRSQYGVDENSILVALFDTSIGEHNPHSWASLVRFYDLTMFLAETLENAMVVMKPKNAGVLPHIASGKCLIVGDPVYTDTNELIAAADVVVAMNLSTTGIEALICGVPTVIRDETGRDWVGVLAHPELLVFDNPTKAYQAVSKFLNRRTDEDSWKGIQERIRYNFGDADGLALPKLRANILAACGVNRTDKSRVIS